MTIIDACNAFVSLDIDGGGEILSISIFVGLPRRDRFILGDDYFEVNQSHGERICLPGWSWYRSERYAIPSFILNPIIP